MPGRILAMAHDAVPHVVNAVVLLMVSSLHGSFSFSFSSLHPASRSLHLPSHTPSIRKLSCFDGMRNSLRLSSMKLADDRENTTDLVNLLRDFRNGIHQEDESKLIFDAQLSSKDRALLHEACERLGLGHESFGQNEERRLSVWKIQTADRLEDIENALRIEKTAARKQWEEAMAFSEPNEMEAAGMLLLNARIQNVDVTDFGRFKWTLAEDASRKGHMTRFNVKTGSPVVLAQRSKSGQWQASQASGSFGFIISTRRGSLDVIFEVHPDQVENIENTESISLLASPDSVTYDRLLQGTRKCRNLGGDSKQILDMMFENDLDDMVLLMSETFVRLNLEQKEALNTSQQFKLEFFDSMLNQEQRDAVEKCCSPQKNFCTPYSIDSWPFWNWENKNFS
uniref:R3H domain-containing protein n=1 Tax=Guillardia theta TaxID=55529 RepID=A0A7S4PQT3_GUITH